MKLHVLQIVPSFVDFNHETGGVSNVVRQISLYLANQDCTVTVLCGNRELGTTKSRPGIIVHKENLVEHVIGQRFHPLLGPRVELTKYLEGCKGNTVAHVHTCFSLFTESAMSECINHGVPFVFTPHGKLSPLMFAKHRGIKKWYWDHKVRNLVDKAAEVVLNGSNESKLFGQLQLQRHCKTIPNGFNELEFAAMGTQKPLIDGPYVLFLGYLEERKQPSFLIEVFAKSVLCSSHKLVIAGPDTYGHKKHLKKLVQSLGVEREVIFFGPAYKDDKWNLLRNASVFSLPSKAEGLPVVLSEAIGAGIPVLYSTGCNFPELAQQGCGLELSGFDIHIWREALERICLDQDLNQKMRVCATQAKARYTWASICKEWEAVYQESAAK